MDTKIHLCGRWLIRIGYAVAAATAILPAQAQTPEVQVSTGDFGDTEFDWGRDGVNCPTCNFGDGNSRFNWTDRTGNLWIAHLDPSTGLLPNQSGQDELVDGPNSAAFWNIWGNGPEWTFSTQNGKVISQLVYSRYADQEYKITGYLGAAYATQTAYATTTNSGWSASFFPGAINGPGNGQTGSSNSNLPEGSQCNTDPVGLAMYKNMVASPNIETFTVALSQQSTSTMTPITNSNGIGERFVPCTHQLLFQGSATSGTHTFQQVFWYNLDTQAIQQLTTDNTSKYAGFMFQAPDFAPLVGSAPNPYIFFTVASRTTIEVYEQNGTNPANGAPTFQLVNQITSPDPQEPYMNSPEPFIHCTPLCQTYVFTSLAKTSDAQNGISQPIGLAIVALNPATPMFKILAAAQKTPSIQREDPEYFITANGPYIYYSRIQVLSATTPYVNQGFYYMDTGLGPPSGPCVGSSAQGGLNATLLLGGPSACLGGSSQPTKPIAKPKQAVVRLP